MMLQCVVVWILRLDEEGKKKPECPVSQLSCHPESFLEADLWVRTNPCAVSEVDPLSTLGFILPGFIMCKLVESLKSHLSTTLLFFFSQGQHGFGG